MSVFIQTQLGNTPHRITPTGLHMYGLVITGRIDSGMGIQVV
jgi:hypothetical protein